MKNPNIERLSFVCECLRYDYPLPPNVKNWFINSLQRWREGERLPDALGVYDSVDEKKARRNDELCSYAAMLDGSIETKTIVIFKNVDLLRQGRKCDPIIASIDKIFKIPESKRQIRRILTNRAV